MEVLENDIDNYLSLFWGVMFEVAEVPTIWFYVFLFARNQLKKNKIQLFQFQGRETL